MNNTTTIISLSIADFCEEGTTVEVTTTNNTFYVQTTDGLHRGDLGCWILTDDSDGDIDYDDYPEIDFDIVVESAEQYISDLVTEIETDFKIGMDTVCLLVNADGEASVVTKNDNFINKDTSSYQRQYSEAIETFDSEDEAIEFLKSMNK